MSLASRGLRRVFIWIGPVITMLLLVVAGFAFWLLGTTQGLRWAVATGVSLAGGEASGVSGSVWQGISLERLRLDTEGLVLDVRDFQFRPDWRALMQRVVHIEELSAGTLAVALETTPDAPDDAPAPFAMPDLPVRVQVDRLALGNFSLTQDGQLLDASLAGLDSSFELNAEGAQLVLHNLEAGFAPARATVNGQVRLAGLTAPWPFEAQLDARLQSLADDGQLCAHHYVPSLPPAPDTDDCQLDIHVRAQGSLDAVGLDIRGRGQGMQLDAQARLAPQMRLPVQDVALDLVLPDLSSLRLEVDAHAGPGHAPGSTQLTARVHSQALDVAGLLGQAIPAAVLSAQADVQLRLGADFQPELARVALSFAPDSIWNDQALSGHVRGQVALPVAGAPVTGPLWSQVHVNDLDVDLSLGDSQIRLAGKLGEVDGALRFDVDAPALAAFWPDLPGGLRLDGQLDGNIGQHALALQAAYTPANSQPDQLGLAPIALGLQLKGGWDRAWRGQLDALRVDHAGLQLAVDGQPALLLAPEAPPGAPAWQLGEAGLRLALHDKPLLAVTHAGSQGGLDGRWATAGRISQLVIGGELVDDARKVLALAGVDMPGGARPQQKGGVKSRGRNWRRDVRITLGMDWDLGYENGLAGKVSLRRLEGDIMVPADTPFRLGLQNLSLDVSAHPEGQGRSRLDARLALDTRRMGEVQAQATTYVDMAPGAPPTLPESAGIALDVRAGIKDLAWLSLFTGDDMEFGGQLDADMRMHVGMDGSWDGSGSITGSGLRVVRVDEGLRLLDGTLSARLEKDVLLLDALEFPARLRVPPKDARTAQWLSSPDAADGRLRVSGQWNLADMQGEIAVGMKRYPVLQRSDRFVMVSGEVQLAAPLPALSVTGNVTIDAGWADLDMLGNVPTLDGDVVIVQTGDEPLEVDLPMDISMQLDVNMGRRFYLTGYGLETGLGGQLSLTLAANKLTAVGALNTRSGIVEAYGQRLSLRNGTVTFQGDIGNPVLSIEALRTGLAVEAGVRVAGTGKRPRIDLISYPEVSEVEKLSWLLFGHGADDSGGDMALLVSVGTSFLGDGQPFYRKFGIDEVSLQSGELGSPGSLLPVESVVSGLNSGANDLERQFILVSKNVSRGFTIGLRQALSDAGTVGRVSYRLARGLTAELSLGTVNGLALVYRWFSRN